MGSKRNRLREKKKRTFKRNQFQSKERAVEKKINVNEDTGPSNPSSTDCKATVEDPQFSSILFDKNFGQFSQFTTCYLHYKENKYIVKRDTFIW